MCRAKSPSSQLRRAGSSKIQAGYKAPRLLPSKLPADGSTSPVQAQTKTTQLAPAFPTALAHSQVPSTHGSPAQAMKCDAVEPQSSHSFGPPTGEVGMEHSVQCPPTTMQQQYKNLKKRTTGRKKKIPKPWPAVPSQVQTHWPYFATNACLLTIIIAKKHK